MLSSIQNTQQFTWQFFYISCNLTEEDFILFISLLPAKPITWPKNKIAKFNTGENHN